MGFLAKPCASQQSSRFIGRSSLWIGSSRLVGGRDLRVLGPSFEGTFWAILGRFWGVFRAFLGRFSKNDRKARKTYCETHPPAYGWKQAKVLILAPTLKKCTFVPACSQSRSLFCLKNRKNLSLIEDPDLKTPFFGGFWGSQKGPKSPFFGRFLALFGGSGTSPKETKTRPIRTMVRTP